MSVKDNQIIDLTADLSDLETPIPSVSSAKKRPRRHSHSKLGPDRDEKRRKGLGFVGEPFAVLGREKHYRAVHYRDMVIEVSRIDAFNGSGKTADDRSTQ
jgi:hypothetical protein